MNPLVLNGGSTSLKFLLVDYLSGTGRIGRRAGKPSSAGWSSGSMERGRSDSYRRRSIPPTGAFLGNYPQTLRHIGVISSEVNLARILKQVGGSK